MRHLRAKAIYPGRVRGTMAEFRRERFTQVEKAAENPRAEYRHFKSALRSAQLQLAAEKKMMLDRRSKSPGEIHAIDDAINVLESHIMTLEDPYFLGEIKNRIFETGATGAAALGAVIGMVSRQFVFEAPGRKFDGNQNRHFIKDMTDMKRRILYFLGLQQDLTLPEGVSIIAAPKLTVSEVLALKRAGVRGIVIGETSDTAHELVMLRAMQIPCVSVSETRFFRMRKSLPVLIDADIGYIVLNPRRAARFTETHTETASPRWSDTVRMKSGEKIQLSGTLHFLTELDTDTAKTKVKQRVGLYRTEYQVSEAGELPSTRQLARQYEELLSTHSNSEITFRLFDFSEDKNFLKSPLIENDRDLRGIRFLLREKKILESQVAALVKAAQETGRPVRLLIPYLSESHELNAVLSIVRGMNSGKKRAVIEIGAMLETPAAIFAAERWLDRVDFFYAGTSDLLSALAMDKREHNEVLHRTLLGDASAVICRTLKSLSEKKPVTICGEVAGEPWAIAWFRYFGFTDFVVPTHRIGVITNMLQALTLDICKKFAREILKIDDEVERLEKARLIALDILYGQS
jgi:phosphoenolpyruvate-protein kinase (PTS system EI component)